MKMFRNPSRRPGLVPSLSVGLALLSFITAQCSVAADSSPSSGDKVPLVIKLPAPAFKGTPKDIQLSAYVEPLSDKPRPPMMVPPGLKNIAPGKKLTCSDSKNGTPGVLAKITDGNKDSSDDS